MNIRHWLNKNPVLGYGLVAGLFALCAAAIMVGMNRGYHAPRLEAYYFYDAGTGELFPASPDQLEPIPAPSGGDGYRAFIFSCSDCADESSRFTGYVRKFTDEAKQVIVQNMDKTDPRIAKVYAAGSLIKTPEGSEWVAEDGPAGTAIKQSIYTRCGGGRFTHSCNVMKN